jgi:hypothetical protein
MELDSAVCAMAVAVSVCGWQTRAALRWLQASHTCTDSTINNTSQIKPEMAMYA